MSLTLRMVGGPYNGLLDKVDFIRRCYRKSLLDPKVLRFAEEAVGRGTRAEQARNLFDFLRDRVRYVPDPVGVEMTKSPGVMVEEILSRGFATGDCDDHSCLAYALLNLVGIRTKLRVIWLGKPSPQHIYVVSSIDDEDVAFDTTRALGFGTEARYTRKEDFL